MEKPQTLKKKMPSMAFLIFFLSAILAFPVNSQPPTLLDPVNHDKFVNPLPIPARIDATRGANFEMVMDQTTQDLGLYDGSNPLGPVTTVWGYGLAGSQVTYPGPTFIAKKDKRVNITWKNKLPGHFLPVDYSLHMAHPSGISDIKAWYDAGNVPTVAHLHGGHTESASDGLPEAWFTQGFSEKGKYFVKQRYTYDNDQEAATLWYHDHALGITRLNVYAGLAGFYLLTDRHSQTLESEGVLPKGRYDIEVVIQDRSFTDQGQLFWPGNPDDPSISFDGAAWNAWDDFIEGAVTENGGDPNAVPRPSVLAEFFGDFIIVNGKAWPKLDVEPRPYRFRMLNGSDSRFYVLRFEGNMSFLQIATDNGFLPSPVSLTELVLAPGERAEIVVDFGVVGMDKSIELKNFGPDEPYGGGTPGIDFAPADPATTGKIMKFNVNKDLRVSRKYPIASVGVGDQLRANPFSGLGASETTRQLALFEGGDEYKRLQPLLGASLTEGTIESLVWDDAITENPGLNDVETWEIYNFTEDAHPVHLHLVAFQIINRQQIASWDEEIIPQVLHGGGVGSGRRMSNITLVPGEVLPADNEKGWKDTFIVPPGWVGRVKARFDRPGRYVWHCHILSHEDHEMMRPYHVGPIAVGLKSESVDKVISVDNRADFRLYPNPMTDEGFVQFTLDAELDASYKLFDLDGRLIQSDQFGVLSEGSHIYPLTIDRIDNGLYILELTTGTEVQRERVLISR